MKSHVAHFSPSYTDILNSISDGVYYVDTNRVIYFWNRAAERITGYASSEVTGSSCRDNILVHVNEKGEQLCTGHCPITAAMATGESQSARVYLHHKDGHRITVSVLISPIMNRSGTIIGAVEVFRDTADESNNAQYIEDLKKAVLLDFLTELPNRRYLESKLTMAFDEQRRYNIPFGILFADLDHFKVVNDTYGHSAGDEVLKMVANILRFNVRRSDMVGRWGGEEFVAVITHISSDQLKVIAEKIRMLTEHSFIKHRDSTLKATITIGVAMATADDTPESLVERADAALYRERQKAATRLSSRVKLD